MHNFLKQWLHCVSILEWIYINDGHYNIIGNVILQNYSHTYGLLKVNITMPYISVCSY